MRNYIDLVKVKTRLNLKWIILLSLISNVLMTISYIMSVEESLELAVIFNLVIFGLIFFIVVLTVIYIILIVFGESVRQKNLLGMALFIMIMIVYFSFFSKAVLEILLSFYNEDSVLTEAQYLGSVISVISILVAIIMPLVLTEKNRKQSLEIIRNNRIDAYMPIFSYRIQGVISNKGSGTLKVLVKDVNKVQSLLTATHIIIKIINVTDRIGMNISYSIDDNINQVTNQPFTKDKEIQIKVDAKEYVERLIEGTKEVIISPSILFEDIYSTKYKQNLTIKIYGGENNNYYAKLSEKSVIQIC